LWVNVDLVSSRASNVVGPFGWHEHPVRRKFSRMSDDRGPAAPRPMRHHVERRVRPDRRSGLDRRITERRLHPVTVLVERRGVTERRSRIERRSPDPRRHLKDRRGSGLTFTSS
jgi:hypothetical protein